MLWRLGAAKQVSLLTNWGLWVVGVALRTERAAITTRQALFLVFAKVTIIEQLSTGAVVPAFDFELVQ